jgi:tRNA A37 N6-isopentenylltransferase MiaA
MAIGKIKDRSFQALGQKEAFKLAYCRIAAGMNWRKMLPRDTPPCNLAAELFGSTGVPPAEIDTSTSEILQAYEALRQAQQDATVALRQAQQRQQEVLNL